MLVDVDLGTGGRHSGGVVSDRHLGGNFLFNRVGFAEQMGADGGFDEVAADLGISHLRYPGGTIAERQFSLTDPENDFQSIDLATGAVLGNSAQYDLQPMTEFLAAAAEAGAKVTIVLPTAQYAGDPARARWEAQWLVQYVMSGRYADVVEAFELGNEWSTFFTSAAAYGEIANAMAIGVDLGLAATGHDALIAVQPSAKAARAHETQEIVDALSPAALAAIDAVVIHDYRPEPWEERSISAQKIGHADLFEAAAGRELEILVSEWNVGNKSANDGLLQGAGLLDLFHTHLANGADRAHVWPLLENNTTRLAGDVDGGNPDAGAGLMIGGAVFRLMAQSLEGTQLLNFSASRDLDGDGSADLLLYGYEAADRLVVFAASLEAAPSTVTLQLDDLADIEDAYQHLWVTEISVADGVDPTHHRSLPVMEQTAGLVASDITLSMDAYQITRLEFAADCGTARCETAALDDLRGTDATEVFVLADDGQRDLIRNFDDTMDRLDVSAFGAQSLDDLTIIERVRKDGSVSWIEIKDAEGTAEAILRFDSGPLTAARLQAEQFIFAGQDATSPVPGMNLIEGTAIRDRLRGTDADDVFVMLDDGHRDLVRDFEDGTDLMDVSHLADRFEDLNIRDLVRRDGTVSWVQIETANGDPEIVVRFTDGVYDASRLTAEDFIF
ncbi:MAG: hypothetical protein AAF479_08900 [Pseudomonadota bacterium]